MRTLSELEAEVKEVPYVLLSRFILRCIDKKISITEGIIECLDWYLSKEDDR
jgi:hypothetical protein